MSLKCKCGHRPHPFYVCDECGCTYSNVQAEELNGEGR